MGSASSRDTHCTVCSFPAGGRNPTFCQGEEWGTGGPAWGGGSAYCWASTPPLEAAACEGTCTHTHTQPSAPSFWAPLCPSARLHWGWALPRHPVLCTVDLSPAGPPWEPDPHRPYAWLGPHLGLLCGDNQ